MKDTDYITILSPMVSKLHLSGNNLIIFALIYGFSKGGENKFNGSIDYISKWTNLSKPTVIATLKMLTECGFLTKTETILNGVKFCSYVANYDEILTGSKETLPLVKKFNGGGKETLPNIDNNNDIDKSISYIKENKDNILSLSKKKEKFCFKQSLIDLGVNENVAESFMVVRKNKKATNTEIAFNAIKKQIEKSGISANECITICVENSWKGFNAEWINNLNRSNNVNKRQSNTSQQFQDNRRLLKIGISYEANGELHLVDGTTFKNNHRYYVARDYKEYSIPVNAPERPDERFEYRNGEGWYLPYDLENADDMVW